MKSVKFKVSGHIVENDLLVKVQEKIRTWENCDVRDIHLYQPSIRAGMDKNSPSIVIFYLTAPDDKFDEFYAKAKALMEQYEMKIIHEEHIGEQW